MGMSVARVHCMVWYLEGLEFDLCGGSIVCVVSSGLYWHMNRHEE